ncbi:unnamed protein product [Arctia plantaginis]|uniref:Uncharacterized protein n=1 Tax=Arctia plantaginis TaxID=874455 RepID=A0A8S0ZS49_ARCPL|nr:unnamed protein product [Arctia plantaginis]
MLFNQLRYLERCYEYPVSSGLFTSISGTFVTVQTFILYLQDSSKVKRTAGIASWAIATWAFIVIFSLFLDMFQKQIEQTKLICAYVQLKPSTPVELLKLTKDILATFEVRDARISLYNVFFFNTGFVFKLAASTFVYITVQLQVALSYFDDENKVDNITESSSFNLDRNRIKEFLFLY